MGRRPGLLPAPGSVPGSGITPPRSLAWASTWDTCARHRCKRAPCPLCSLLSMHAHPSLLLCLHGCPRRHACVAPDTQARQVQARLLQRRPQLCLCAHQCHSKRTPWRAHHARHGVASSRAGPPLLGAAGPRRSNSGCAASPAAPAAPPPPGASATAAAAIAAAAAQRVPWRHACHLKQGAHSVLAGWRGHCISGGCTNGAQQQHGRKAGRRQAARRRQPCRRRASGVCSRCWRGPAASHLAGSSAPWPAKASPGGLVPLPRRIQASLCVARFASLAVSLLAPVAAPCSAVVEGLRATLLPKVSPFPGLMQQVFSLPMSLWNLQKPSRAETAREKQ